MSSDLTETRPPTSRSRSRMLTNPIPPAGLLRSGSNPLPAVPDPKTDGLRVHAEFNVRALRLTMLNDIAKRFLGNAKQTQCHVLRDIGTGSKLGDEDYRTSRAFIFNATTAGVMFGVTLNLK
jgi:hypothetical protein